MTPLVSPFVITGTQRTGSSVLATTLARHPGINCGWEWTLKVNPLKRIAIVRSGLRGDFEALPEPHRSVMRGKAGAPNVGFRLLFSSSPKWRIDPRLNLAHFWERMAGFIRFFSRHPEVKVIHVIRSDGMSWLGSLFVAKASRLYINQQYPENLRVTIPIGEAMRRLQAKHRVEQRIRELRRANPYLEIHYEDLLRDRETVYGNIFAFLDLHSTGIVPDSPIKKQMTRPLSDVIVNHGELAGAIARFRPKW